MNPVSFPHRVPGGLRLSGLATGGLGLVVALAAGAAPSPPRGPITNLRGQLISVSAVSPSDAWAVGLTNRHADLVLHWNGTRWTPATGVGPATELLGVSALSANDVWAVGQGSSGRRVLETVVLHWNGTRWAHVASPNPGPAPPRDGLAGVSALSPSDAWAVGGSGHNTLVLHWNGTRWAQVASPDPSRSGNQLFAVSAASPSDVWAVGESGTSSPRGLMLHWNGTAWAQVPIPHPGRGTGTLTGVDALSRSDAWAVGSYDTGRGTRISAKTLVLHWNGTNWTQVTTPSPGPVPMIDSLAEVSALSPSDAWAVGESTISNGNTEPLVLHWNGTSWAQVASPQLGHFGSSLFGVSPLSPGDAWAVGVVINANNFTTLVLHWNGTSWTRS